MSTNNWLRAWKPLAKQASYSEDVKATNQESYIYYFRLTDEATTARQYANAISAATNNRSQNLNPC